MAQTGAKFTFPATRKVVAKNKTIFSTTAHLEAARPHVDKAALLVHKTGYVRSDGEVSDLKEKLGR